MGHNNICVYVYPIEAQVNSTVTNGTHMILPCSHPIYMYIHIKTNIKNQISITSINDDDDDRHIYIYNNMIRTDL